MLHLALAPTPKWGTSIRVNLFKKYGTGPCASCIAPVHKEPVIVNQPHRNAVVAIRQLLIKQDRGVGATLVVTQGVDGLFGKA